MVDEAKPTDRRSREQMRRAARQRRLNIVGSVLTVGIVVLVALLATDTVRVGGRGPLLASGKSTASTTSTTANAKSQVAKVKKNKPPRPLSHAAPEGVSALQAAHPEVPGCRT